MRKEKSLKKEILLTLISFSIFISISIGFISMINFYLSKLTIIEHNQKQTIYQVESEVNKFLTQIYNLSTYIQHNYNENSSLLKNIVDTNDNVSSILILSNEGVIEDFYAKTNLNIYKGFDYSNQEYFKEIKNKVTDYWSNVFLSTVDEEPALSYSFISKDKVVVLMIKLKEVSDFISRFKNKDGTHMLKVFDSRGNIILNPDNPDLVFQRFNEKTQKVFTDLIDKLEPYTFTIFYSEIFNQKEYGTYTTVKKTGWKIVVRESYELILKSLNNIIFGMIFTILIFICAAIFLSLQISKRVFKSLDDLQQTTTNIADGNYIIENKKSYYSEFNILLKSFNKMKVEIDKREDSLEASLSSFKSLFNSTMEAIVIHNKGICIDANNVAIQFLGLRDKEELIGKNLLDYVEDKYKELVIKNYKENTFPYEFNLLVKEQKVTCLGQGKFIKLNGKEVKLSTLIDITELKQKDKLLFQQSKMAAMGEMIGNIAHQWRQPLSVITVLASSLKVKKELDILEEKDYLESYNLILETANYLSNTIDDFQYYFSPNKNKNSFNTKNLIDKSLKLSSMEFKEHNINVIKNIEEFEALNFENELLQVVINILNNAKDELIKKDAKRYIFIDLFKEDKNIIIKIKDNAGGIDKNVIDRVFEPYFTTKHKSKGTGIGLYMCQEIIVKHIEGTIQVSNEIYEYENEEFIGAKFEITLAL